MSLLALGTALNAADNCPNIANPGQADFDADGIGNHCDDSDGDSFTDQVELYVGTSPTASCGANSWPPDLTNDRTVDIRDLGSLRPSFNSTLGDTNYSARADFNADGRIDIRDIGALRPVFRTSCA